MKTILLWSPAAPGGDPERLELDDALASACVRAGVAAAADPAEAGVLSVGASISADDPVDVVFFTGTLATPVIVTVPRAVADIARQLGQAGSPVALRKYLQSPIDGSPIGSAVDGTQLFSAIGI